MQQPVILGDLENSKEIKTTKLQSNKTVKSNTKNIKTSTHSTVYI